MTDTYRAKKSEKTKPTFTKNEKNLNSKFFTLYTKKCEENFIF